MCGDRRTTAYREGVHFFRDAAEANKHGVALCFVHVLNVGMRRITFPQVIQSHLLRSGFMSGYNVWTKHGERGVMMEDGDEEENDDDNYRSMFPEYADTTMEDNEEEDMKNGHQMSPPMILVGSLLMQSDTGIQKRRGCSSSRCYRTTTNCCTQLVKMDRRSWVAHWNC